MKYVCPECKHVGEFEAVFRKQDIECETCMYKVFTPLAKALYVLEISVAVIVLVVILFLKTIDLSIWLSAILLFALLGFWKLIEYLLCRRANAKVMDRDF